MNVKPMPGVMLYFDRLSFLDRLDDAQTGRLFRAVIRYARDGEEPEIDDVMFGMAWDVLRPMLDYDAQRYAEVSEKRRLSALRRWEKAQANANASVCMPNTDTSTDTAPDTNQHQPKSKSRRRSRSRRKTILRSITKSILTARKKAARGC